MSEIANPVERFAFRSSVFSLFGSSIQFHPLEQGSAHPKRLERLLGHLSFDKGLFLFEQAEIELSFPRLDLTTLNSMTFGPISIQPSSTSGFPKASKLKVSILHQAETQSQNPRP